MSIFSLDISGRPSFSELMKFAWPSRNQDLLNLSEQTVRRRIRSRELPRVRVETSQGFIWAAELPDDSPTEQPYTGEDKALREFIAVLQAEIERLHVELESRRREAQQFQAALPIPDEKKPWWRRWFGKS
jgi:hypothetical protein